MNWQKTRLVNLMLNDQNIVVCSLCNDCNEPIYFTRKYNAVEDNFDIQFIWKLTEDYLVKGVTTEQLGKLSSLNLDNNYNHVVKILRGIMEGQRIMTVEHPYHDNYFVDMTENVYKDMVTLSKQPY